MKRSLFRYSALLLLLILISGLCLMFAESKSGMFIDEIYTYGLSNSHEGAYIRDAMGGSLVDKAMSRDELLRYVVVNEGESFDFKAVYANQAADVHPPLYYWLFNIASSLTPGVFSKWTGLILDLIIYLAALVLLYMLAKELFDSDVCALAAVAIYGTSLLGLSTMLMIRMYVLLSMLTILLAYLTARLMREKKPSLYILTGLTIFAGVMTQYYFVFYAFFLCAAFVFHSLYKRDFKGTLIFAASAFAGILLLLICFPPCISQLFADKLVSGGNALENLTDSSQYAQRLVYFFKEVRHGMKAAIIIAMAVAAALLVFVKKVIRCAKDGKLGFRALLFVIPAFVTLILVALISPVMDQRYVYNIVPIFAIAVCMLISWLERSTADIKLFGTLKWIALVGVVLFTAWFARWSQPLYQYPEHSEYNAVLSEHSDDPCIYLTDNKFEPITEALIQLLSFDEFFMTDSADSPALDEYLAKFDSDECIVFIDINEFWSSGFDAEKMLPEFIESTDFERFELLYSYGLSQTYLVTK